MSLIGMFVGKYAADAPTSERISQRSRASVSSSTSSILRYNQYKSLTHAQKSLNAVDAQARDAARRRRSERMTATLKARLREVLSYYSAACDRLSFPGHGGVRVSLPL
jgi:hypothetical protein